MCSEVWVNEVNLLKELQATTSELQATTSELQETKRELQATKRELQELKDKFELLWLAPGMPGCIAAHLDFKGCMQKEQDEKEEHTKIKDNSPREL
jgi:phage-related minor tail protein